MSLAAHVLVKEQAPSGGSSRWISSSTLAGSTTEQNVNDAVTVSNVESSKGIWWPSPDTSRHDHGRC